MTNPDPLVRTTLSVSEKARARVKSMQDMLRGRLGYKPGYSEVVIKGMEALEREQESGNRAGNDRGQ